MDGFARKTGICLLLLPILGQAGALGVAASDYPAAPVSTSVDPCPEADRPIAVSDGNGGYFWQRTTTDRGFCGWRSPDSDDNALGALNDYFGPDGAPSGAAGQ